jgi:hypothetical protein
MKLFLDQKNRRFIKSAASNVALQTLHLKRRDQVPIEIVFVSNNAVTPAPAGTTTAVGLKAKFSDANFLAYAPAGTALLDLFTQPVETAFASNPASLPALLEVRWSAPGESLRTATLQVELQNSVILGTEGTPAAAPDLKATQAEAEAGTSNEKWMTPLRTAQAIAELAPPTTWTSVTGKPESFPPSSHTHTASQITDFSSAVVAAAPPTTDASLLTSGTLADARLSAATTDSLAKAATALQPDSLGGVEVSYLSAKGYNLGENNPQPGEVFLQAAASALGVSIRPASLTDDRVLITPDSDGTLALTPHADGRTQQLFFTGISSPASTLGRPDDYYLRRDGSTSVTIFRKNNASQWEAEATLATSGAVTAATQSLTDSLATLESSLGTLATQSAEAVEITGGSAHFDTLSAGTDHAAADGYLTVAANGDLLGTGANRILGFIAGGATY